MPLLSALLHGHSMHCLTKQIKPVIATLSCHHPWGIFASQCKHSWLDSENPPQLRACVDKQSSSLCSASKVSVSLVSGTTAIGRLDTGAAESHCVKRACPSQAQFARTALTEVWRRLGWFRSVRFCFADAPHFVPFNLNRVALSPVSSYCLPLRR